MNRGASFAPRPQQSVIGQATHNGITNFTGNNIVKPIAQFPIDAGNQLYNRVAAPTFGLPKLTPQQSPLRGLANNVGATGSLHQTVGSGIQTALTIGSGGLAKGIEAGVGKLLPAVAPKVISTLAPKVASNAVIGAGFNASAAAGAGAKPMDIVKSAGVGAALGGALPVAGAIAKPVVKLTGRALADATRTTAKAVQVADTKAFTPRTSVQDQTALRDYADYLVGANKAKGAEVTQLHTAARTAAAKHGVDITSGPVATRLENTNSILDRLGMRNKQVAQGGFARIPGKPTPQVGKPTVTERINALPSDQAPHTTPQLLVKPAILKPVSAVSAKTAPQLPQEGSTTSSLVNNTPADYIKQQIKAQDQARKAGEITTTSKVKTEFANKFIDNLSPIETTLKKAVKNGADVPLSRHITPQLDRALRSDSIAGQYIKDHGLAKVIQNVPDTKAFDQYLIAKHAQDLAANGVKTGRNLTADKQLIESLKATYEPHAQAVMKYNQGLLDKAVSYGLVSKETATALKVKYPNYVPANRIFGDGELTNFKGNGSGKASISSQSVVQKIKGSTRQIESPLASISNKTVNLISQGERNKAASILAGYKDLPGNPFNLREMKPSETVGAKSTVSYLDKGKVRRFETTPEIATAAKALNKEQIGIIGKIVRVPTRILRLGATGVNPGFALANISKDLVSAAINTEHPLRASVFNPKVLGKASSAAFNHNSKSYAELVRQGAGGTSFDIARDAPRETIAQIRADKNAGTKIMYNVTHPAQLIRAVENTIGRSEEFSRALQYYGNKDAALTKGMSKADAITYGANAARNNTVNFARHGEYGAVLNSALPYLNAGIQGSRTLLRNVRDRPAQTLTKVAVLSTLPVLTTTSWNLSDPKRRAAYNDISNYEKEGNMIIVPSNPVKDPKTGKWNVIKIPVSQEIANLNNIARNALEAGMKNGSMSMTKVLGDLIGTSTSLNAQSGRQVANQLIPQALKPGVEMLTNQSLFTGNQIIPNSQKNLPAKDQYGNYTSGTAKMIGKVTGTSPSIVDNTIRTSTGGAGQNAINVTDTVLAKMGLIDKSNIRGKSFADSIAGRFSGASSKPLSDTIQGTFNTARDQLTAMPEYKALSQVDKAKALNRLQTDIQSIQYNATDTANPGNGYTAKPLTKNQQAYVNGTKSLASYTISPSSTSTAGDPAATYQKHLADYQTAKKAGTLSGPKDYSTQLSLAKEAITSQYPQSVLDFYGLSKANQNAYFASDRVKATALYNQAKQLDAQLVGKGISSTKFATAVTGAKSKSGSSRTSKSSGSKTSKGVSVAKYASVLKSTLPKAQKKVTAPHFTVNASKLPAGYKTPTLRQYTVAKVSTPSLKKLLSARKTA